MYVLLQFYLIFDTQSSYIRKQALILLIKGSELKKVDFCVFLKLLLCIPVLILTISN